MNQRGNATVTALAIMILFSAFTAAFYAIFRVIATRHTKSAEELASRGIALNAMYVIRDVLEAGGKDGVDSKADLEKLPTFNDVEYVVEDISSRLNLNFLASEVFESPTMAEFSGGSSGYNAIRDVRQLIGPSIDLVASYGSIIDEAAIDRLFSPYSYANINTDDPEALARFYVNISGNTDGESAMEAKIVNLRKTKKKLDRTEFALAFGISPTLYPLICVEPQINANQAERIVLEAILSTPAYKVKYPIAICDALCMAADNDILDQSKIIKLLGPDPDPRLSSWLGSRTWFWRISLDIHGCRYIAILRRVGAVAGSDVLVLSGFFKDEVTLDG